MALGPSEERRRPEILAVAAAAAVKRVMFVVVALRSAVDAVAYLVAADEPWDSVEIAMDEERVLLPAMSTKQWEEEPFVDS